MPDADRDPPLPLVVMGVSGSGKSTIAAQLAERIGGTFIDGDDLHPQSNVDKMHAGHPLDEVAQQCFACLAVFRHWHVHADTLAARPARGVASGAA